jgi:hypothetical protein
MTAGRDAYHANRDLYSGVHLHIEGELRDLPAHRSSQTAAAWNEITSAVEIIAALSSLISGLHRTRQSLDGQVGSLTVERDGLRAELRAKAELSAELQGTQERLDDTSQRLAAAVTYQRGLEQRLSEAERRRTEAERLKAVAEANFAQACSRLAEFEKDVIQPAGLVGSMEAAGDPEPIMGDADQQAVSMILDRVDQRLREQDGKMHQLRETMGQPAPWQAAPPAASPSPSHGSASIPGLPSPSHGSARIPGVPSPSHGSASIPGVPSPSHGSARIPGVPLVPGTTRYRVPAARAMPRARVTVPASAATASPVSSARTLAAARPRPNGSRAIPSSSERLYDQCLPSQVQSAFFLAARTPIARAELLYKEIANQSGISWKLLAACDWMQCQSKPNLSPVQGERLGTVNADGTVYKTKSGALAQCASDLIELARGAYGIDLTEPRRMSVPALADVFAAFRWGGLLRRHGVSSMEFPYSVEGLTEAHVKMRWPTMDEPSAPDKPGRRFRMPFGAVPVVLSLGYRATR